MAKWKELLADKNSFPDDFVVSVKVNGKDETLSLGEMRAYDIESKGALTADLTRREQDLSNRESNFTKALISLGTVVEKAASAAGLTVDELLEGKAPTRRQLAEAADLDEKDPLVGKLVKEMRGLKATIESQGKEIERTRKEALGPMLNTYLADYYENKWEKVEGTLPKGSKVTRDETIKYAQDNKITDPKTGRLDLARAVRDLTYEDRINEEASKRATELRKKDDDARVLASAPKPSGTHISIKTDKSLLNSKGQTKSIDEALLDAANDTDLWRGIAGQA